MTNDDKSVNPGCIYGAQTRERVKTVEERYIEFTQWIQRLENKVDDALAQARKRPGWPTLVIITFLSSLSVGLIVAIVVRSMSSS